MANNFFIVLFVREIKINIAKNLMIPILVGWSSDIVIVISFFVLFFQAKVTKIAEEHFVSLVSLSECPKNLRFSSEMLVHG